jgi:hypothetical protein
VLTPSTTSGARSSGISPSAPCARAQATKTSSAEKASAARAHPEAEEFCSES